MSGWLKDGEVLEGEGSGQASPYSSRHRGTMSGRGGRPSPNSPGYMYQTTGLAKHDTMSKAKMLFKLCDKEDKGFITKRDMQRLQAELPLTAEQLESVFESLDRDRNGYLTPLEFHTGLGELVEECEEKDPAEIRFTQILMELGADKFLKDQWELCSLWCDLQKDKPELLTVLEEILAHAVTHLQDSLRERDSLERALRRREDDHDRMVRSLYEDLENQLREEREKRLTLETSRHESNREQLMQELRMREQELEFTLTKQRELESKIEALCRDQASMRTQNQRLQHVNAVLREQLDESREELHKALSQLQKIQESVTDQQEGNQRQVQTVSRNMQKERESLTRQLDLLRDMNKRLRDDRDARQDQKRTPKMKRRLEKQGSVIGDYFLVKKPSIRQVSFPGRTKTEPPNVTADAQPMHLSRSQNQRGKTTVEMFSEIETGPHRVFKVVFLGSSGVGKSSFIHQYCKEHFLNNMSTTVGVDFQVKSFLLDSTHIALQLWDTAGQERFHSITQQYYRKADGILVMYDITQIPSFMAVRDWLDQVQKNMAEGTCLMLVGNKLDMEDEGRRHVTTKQGQKVAEEHQAEFFECSAKSGLNIQEAMTHLARLMASQEDKQRESVLQLMDSSIQRGRCCT